jgi:hypothetical protein
MKTGFLHKNCSMGFLLLFVFLQLNAQQDTTLIDPDDPTGTIEAQLTAMVQSQFGSQYSIGFQVLDSVIARNGSTSDYGEVTDPYGTLKGYVLFGADKSGAYDNEHGIMGLYKNGQIVWHSDPIFKGIWGGTFSIKDINNDGKVDLLVEWTPGAQMVLVRHLWIISWDGSIGTIINQVNDANGNTTIHASESMFELIPTDMNSPLVIRARWPDEEDFFKWFPQTHISTLPYVTYSWNSSQYGLWPNTRQIPKDEYLPANLINVITSCKVIRSSDSLKYTYSLKNASSSRQYLRSIALLGLENKYSVNVSSEWEYWGYMQTKPIAYWTYSSSRDNDGVGPGEDMSFDLVSASIPSIVRFYLQGSRPSLEATPESADATLGDQFVSDILNNSVVARTIGPIAVPVPLIPLNFVDTLNNYVTQSRNLAWIKDQTTANKYLGRFNSAKASLQGNNIAAARATLGQVLTDVNVDSTANLTSEAYALIRYNTEYLLSQLPANPAPGLAVRLTNSGGTALAGGSLQYYEGSWKDAVNNNDGTFTVNTSQSTVSLRMTYAYGSQSKSNVPVNGGPVIFQTINTQVRLQNSQGTLMDQGVVQYYAGAWRDFRITTNGVATMELLPASYSFRMTYAYGSNDKQQDVGSNPVVIFQTVNAAVQLKSSQGNLMPAPLGDAGTVQYYAGAWRDFGSTMNGVVTKELLPNNYSFRMTYAFASKDMQQNIGTNRTVVFSTVNATVQLKNSLGNLIDAGAVQYYAGAWRDFGATTNGLATKELLPNNYSFRMTYEFVSNDKAQDIGTNNTVGFSTVLCTVRPSNMLGQMLSGAVVSYYAGAWRQIGSTVNGQITKELLPANLSFRASYGGRSQDKQQNLSTNAVVDIVLP